jgi:hypothetical protein
MKILAVGRPRPGVDIAAGLRSVSSNSITEFATSGSSASSSRALPRSSSSRIRTTPGPPGEYISRVTPREYMPHTASSSALACELQPFAAIGMLFNRSPGQ